MSGSDLVRLYDVDTDPSESMDRSSEKPDLVES